MTLRNKMTNLLDNVKPIAKPSLKVAVVTTYAVSPFLFNKGPITFEKYSKHSLGGSRLGVASKNNMRRITNSNRNIYLPLKSYPINNSEKVPYLKAFDVPILNHLKGENVKLNAAALIIDGKPVAYVRNRIAAEQVIRNLELKYVTEDQLNHADALKSSLMDSFSPVKEKESQLLNIHLSKMIIIQDVKIPPDKIIPIEKAVLFLQKGTLKETKYKVQEGDVLGVIANNHGLRLEELLELNPQLNRNSIIIPGQEITIAESKPYIKVLVEKVVNQIEVIPYPEEVVYDPEIPKGERKIRQQGIDGLGSVTYNEVIENGNVLTKKIAKKEILKQPRNQIVVKGSKPAPSRGEGIFSWPADGGYISSQMGYRGGKLHKGIDIARPSNYKIKAADNGVVISAGWDSGYGNKIIIDHQNGFQTVYAHLYSIKVNVGEMVQKGSSIGIMGETGEATGIHLHFEVYKNGVLKNPLQYLSM